MSEKKTSFQEKIKVLGANRGAVITAGVLVIAMVVIISVAIASNRTKKDDLPPAVTTPDRTETTTPEAETTSPEAETTAPETTSPETSKVTKVEDKLPSFSLPVSGSVTKKHDPTLQVFSNTMNDYRVHLGVDIETEAGAPVYSAADGKVSKIWEDPMMGYCVAVEHGGDCFTIYKNLSKELPEGIAEGRSVRAGQLIASVGDSAMVEVAEEPHLHFEMTVEDLAVDPLKYFDERSLEALGIKE